MNYAKNNASASSGLYISDDVIASIAVAAVKDVPGVGRILQRPKNLKSMIVAADGAQRFVEVLKIDNVYVLKLHITVSEESKIPTVAAAVQKAVKNAVQEMTSKVVSKVNVVISGVEIKNCT